MALSIKLCLSLVDTNIVSKSFRKYKSTSGSGTDSGAGKKYIGHSVIVRHAYTPKEMIEVYE